MGRVVFTALVGLVLTVALVSAWSWPVRASIIVLTLGGAGLALTALQLGFDLRRSLAEATKDRLIYEVPATEAASRWGYLEAWGWIVGFYLAIHVVGFPAAASLFVLAYVKVYGGGWLMSAGLAALGWGFLYGVFDRVLHVPWPEPLFKFLM